jgi:hypothetical protein
MNGRIWSESNRLVSDICTSAINSEIEFKLSGEQKKKYNITHDDYMYVKNNDESFIFSYNVLEFELNKCNTQ